MAGIIKCASCVCVHFVILLIITTGFKVDTAKRNIQEKVEDVVEIEVNENEDTPRGVSLHVTTTHRVYKLKLHHTPSILHPDIETFLITSDADKKLELSSARLDTDVQRIDSHFYHNLSIGCVISLGIDHNGRNHVVEGFLDHHTAIAPPPLSKTRHRRSSKTHGRHIVYTVTDDGVHAGYKNARWKDQILMNSILEEGLERLYGKDALVEQLINSHRDIEGYGEDDEDDSDDDDYKEVPSFFDTEETWTAHQRQAEANTNLVKDTKDFDHDGERLTLMALFKQIAFKKPNINILKPAQIVSSSDSAQQSDVPPPSRFKRNVHNEEKELLVTRAHGTIHSGREQEREQELQFHHSGTTEESSLKQQMTTLEMPSQIPGPLDTDRTHSTQSQQWQVQSTTLKHRDKTDRDEPNILPRDKNRLKRQIPFEVQPGMEQSYGRTTTHEKRVQKGKFAIEVHAVVDAALYQDFNYNWKALQLFLLHFWQSVNSRFQALVNPNVRIQIKAISKIMFPGFQPFVENSRVKNASSDWVDVDRVLEDFRSYVQDHFELNPLVPDHDVVFLMTGEDLCKRRADNSWSKKSRGIAYVRGACISARRFQSETYDVGISEVGRSFSGVLTTTHELAHLVGAYHDGEKSALPCPPTSGYIMGEAWNDPVKYNQFSRCSTDNMKDFLQTAWYADCLTESKDHKNAVAYTFPAQLAGQVFSLEEQCFHFIEGVPCKNVPLSSQCGRLCCEKWSQVFKSREPAADGTKCGSGKICQIGRCVKEDKQQH